MASEVQKCSSRRARDRKEPQLHAKPSCAAAMADEPAGKRRRVLSPDVSAVSKDDAMALWPEGDAWSGSAAAPAAPSRPSSLQQVEALSPSVQYHAARKQRDSATRTSTDRFCARLHQQLRRLAPELRRAAIAKKLTQLQRLALERWMLKQAKQRRLSSKSEAHRPVHAGHADKHLSTCSRPRRVSGVAAQSSHTLRSSDKVKGRCPCVHLDNHLYAQSARCTNTLSISRAEAMLSELRARRLHASRRGAMFEQCVAIAVQEMRQETGGAAVPLYFRTRISFARGVRLSTPLRQDAATALEDWHRMVGAWGSALFSGGRLRPDCTPQSAEAQWTSSCKAWFDIWSEWGRPPGYLGRAIAVQEAVRKPVWAKAVREWAQLQARTMCRITQLLELQAPREEATGREISRGKFRR